MRTLWPVCLAALIALNPLAPADDAPAKAPRGRDLGIPFEGTPGKLNAITDVAGVEVGHRTIIKDAAEGGRPGAARTGVTAVLPRGTDAGHPVFAGYFSLNGNGEMTGTHWVEEGGILEGAVLLTNTLAVGAAHTAAVKWAIRHAGRGEDFGALPVVAETWDGDLNDIKAFHVTEADAAAALAAAKSGPVAEGNVGGGTGMICYDFKGGIGTASRVAAVGDTTRYAVGVLVQANQGDRKELLVAGVPVGRELPAGRKRGRAGKANSIIVVVATDAPLMPHQLKRLARRAAHGVARTGTVTHDGSGEIFLAFSTANRKAAGAAEAAEVRALPNEQLDGLFEAVVQATEEAIVNALVAARTMTGFGGTTVEAIGHDDLRRVLRKYNRLGGR